MEADCILVAVCFHNICLMLSEETTLLLDDVVDAGASGHKRFDYRHAIEMERMGRIDGKILIVAALGSKCKCPVACVGTVVDTDFSRYELLYTARQSLYSLFKFTCSLSGTRTFETEHYNMLYHFDLILS